MNLKEIVKFLIQFIDSYSSGSVLGSENSHVSLPLVGRLSSGGFCLVLLAQTYQPLFFQVGTSSQILFFFFFFRGWESELGIKARVLCLLGNYSMLPALQSAILYPLSFLVGRGTTFTDKSMSFCRSHVCRESHWCVLCTALPTSQCEQVLCF